MPKPLFSQEIKTADSSRCYVEVRKVSMYGTRVVLSQYFGLPTLCLGFTLDQAEVLNDNLNEAILVARSAPIAPRPTSRLATIFGYFFPKILFKTTTPVDFPNGTLTVRVEQTPRTTANKIVLGYEVDTEARISFTAEDAELLTTVLAEASDRLREFLKT